jgi:hypothetical protein
MQRLGKSYDKRKAYHQQLRLRWARSANNEVRVARNRCEHSLYIGFSVRLKLRVSICKPAH